MDWIKIADLELQKSTLKLLNNICLDIDNNVNIDKYSPTLYSGLAGMSLFYGYLSKVKGFESKIDNSRLFIEKSLELISEMKLDNTITEGYTGICWAIQHLVNKDIVEFDECDEYLTDLDEIIFNETIIDLENKHFDFLQGGIGSGIYFIERYKSNNYVKKYLSEMVKKISGLITINKSWQSKVEKVGDINNKRYISKEIEEYNFGLSHGIPSILAFLSLCYLHGIETKLTRNLIISNINWIRKFERLSNNTTRFPATVAFGYEDELLPVNLGWCYGDLSLAKTFHNCGVIINDKELISYSINLALNCCNRKEFDIVETAQLCHGNSGIAHIFNHFYQHTKNERFKNIALLWYKEIFNKSIHNDTNCGIKNLRFDSDQNRIWLNEFGFLEGISGIGLSLVSSISEIKPDWDRCLFLS